MTNFDRAAHLIMEAARESELPTETAVNAVEALAKAGLIMPDLPEPKEIDHRVYRWNSTHTRAAYDIRSGAAEEVDAPGGVTVYADPEGDSEIWVDVDHGEQLLTPTEARALALSLIHI